MVLQARDGLRRGGRPGGLEPSDTLVPFAFTGPGIPRQDNPVHTEHGDGVVTKNSLSPCLEVGIGMAYVPVAAAAPGTKLEVDVHGKVARSRGEGETALPEGDQWLRPATPRT